MKMPFPSSKRALEEDNNAVCQVKCAKSHIKPILNQVASNLAASVADSNAPQILLHASMQRYYVEGLTSAVALACSVSQWQQKQRCGPHRLAFVPQAPRPKTTHVV